MVTYHLIPDRSVKDLSIILSKISDYLNTFTGDIVVKQQNESEIEIIYSSTSFTATAKVVGEKIILTTHEDDSVTINLIKNISNNSNFRIFNVKGYFLPNDPKLMDISSVGIDKKIYDILKKENLKPVFQYRDSLIFFCLNKREEVCLINRHYLEYLLAPNPHTLTPSELSVVVSPGVSSFIALFDRGLISLVFPKYQSNDTKVINLSGFDIQNLDDNSLLQVTNFRLDKDKQQFIQESTTDKIINKNYLALKINQDYNYKQSLPLRGKQIDGKLYKVINLSCFYEA
jgi:hypothetical protein